MKITRNKSDEVLAVADQLIRLRTWEKAHLPIEQSTLALDLFLEIAFHTLQGQPITLKALFASVHFSEAGARKQLRRLMTQGWCRLENGQHDKRLRHVVAEPKMLDALFDYVQILHILLGPRD